MVTSAVLVKCCSWKEGLARMLLVNSR